MCTIEAVDFEATFEGQKLKKSYIAKYAPDGPRAAMLEQVQSIKLIEGNIKVKLTFANSH